jgi:hypothetical protein
MPLSDVVNNGNYLDDEGVERTATGRLVIRPADYVDPDKEVMSGLGQGDAPVQGAPTRLSPTGVSQAIQGNAPLGELGANIAKLRDYGCWAPTGRNVTSYGRRR